MEQKEKIVLTADRNEEKHYFENKHICVKEDVIFVKPLTFKNCVIEDCGGRIYAIGIMDMDNCEIIGSGCKMPLNPNAEFIDAAKGMVRNCKFDSFITRYAILANYIKYSSFSHCKGVKCGYGEGINEMRNCTFYDCSEIDMLDGLMQECKLESCAHVYLADAEIRDCTFSNSCHADEEMMFMCDGKICGCHFENITLMEEQYMFEARGDSELNRCTFKNIRTTRDDLEIANGEDTVGKVFKKNVWYDLIDTSSCKGLEDIEYIGEEEEDDED